MLKTSPEIDNITRQFVEIYNPHKLILFGSQAKNKSTAKSDIDLCVVAKIADKRTALTDMYLNIECDRPFDLLLYTPDEWERNVTDHTSFAYQINKEGVVLHG